jgi:phycocyanin beta chain
MKDAALAIVGDTNGITRGDCSAIMSEVAGYFDRAAASVG